MVIFLLANLDFEHFLCIYINCEFGDSYTLTASGADTGSLGGLNTGLTPSGEFQLPGGGTPHVTHHTNYTTDQY